jgi:hypothetical protein
MGKPWEKMAKLYMKFSCMPQLFMWRFRMMTGLAYSPGINATY